MNTPQPDDLLALRACGGEAGKAGGFDPSTSLAALLHRVALGMRSRLHQLLLPQAFSVPHFVVLYKLSVAGPCSQMELGDAACIHRTRMVGLLDDLERLGLAERRRDTRDRRVYRVHLTDAGREALTRAAEQHRAVEAEWLADFSDAERATLLGLLTRLAGHAPPPGSGPPPACGDLDTDH